MIIKLRVTTMQCVPLPSEKYYIFKAFPVTIEIENNHLRINGNYLGPTWQVCLAGPVWLGRARCVPAASWHRARSSAPPVWAWCRRSRRWRGPGPGPSGGSAPCQCGLPWSRGTRCSTSWRRLRGPTPWWSGRCSHSPSGCRLIDSRRKLSSFREFRIISSF